MDKDKTKNLFEGKNSERRDELDRRIILEDFHRSVVEIPDPVKRNVYHSVYKVLNNSVYGRHMSDFDQKI